MGGTEGFGGGEGVEKIHDDHCGHSDRIYDSDPNGNSHFHLLRRYLKVCAQHRIRISPKKFILFATQVEFGGRLHGEGGMRPKPPRYQSIVEEPDPQVLDEVYSGMLAKGWNRTFIPNYAIIEQPVRAFVMSKLGAGKKTKQRAKNIKLTLENGWTPELSRAYKRLRLAVIDAISRAYRDYDKVSFLMWDASKYAWSYSVTQVAPEELLKPWCDQQHELLVTRCGLFKGPQIDWPTGCKEGYPPTRALDVDAEFLEGKHPFLAGGDHRNIVYIMNKKRRPALLKQTSHDRLNRWCLQWAHADFQIYHVPGEMNLFNDFHSRAGAPRAEPLYTLADHARKVEEKLNQLREDVGDADTGAAAPAAKSTETSGGTVTHKHVDVAKQSHNTCF